MSSTCSAGVCRRRKLPERTTSMLGIVGLSGKLQRPTNPPAGSVGFSGTINGRV